MSADHRDTDTESLDDLEINGDDVEAAREQALDWLDNMDDAESYEAGWIDGVVMMDRLLTDPEYFGLRDD